MIDISYTVAYPHRVRFRSGTVFSEIVAHLKCHIRPVMRHYEPTTKEWMIYDWDALSRWFQQVEYDFPEETITIHFSAPENLTDRNPTNPTLPTDAERLYVTQDAPAAVIKAAYYALAKLHHPDNGGDTALMQEINAAYGRLKIQKGIK